ARLAFPQDGDLVTERSGEMAIEAVVRGVDLTADEPFGVRFVPLKDAIPAFEPVQPLGLGGPEAVGSVVGLLPQGLVLDEALDVGLSGEVGRRRKGTVFLENAGNVRRRGRGHGTALQIRGEDA